MNIQFSANEFTTMELLTYMNKAYGAQINGAPFSSYNINNWIRIGKIPMAYGDNRILRVERLNKLGSITVLMIEGLNRDVLTDLELLESKLPAIHLLKTKRPRKQRTKLYFKILEDVSKQYTRKTLSILPDNWKEIGIKTNQLARSKRKKW